MNKIFSSILAGLAAISCCISMASCSDSSENCLVMVTDANFPPFEYLDENGNIVGFDIDVAQAIAEKIGMTLKIENISFKKIIDEIENGKYDFAMAGLTVSEERKEQVMFSNTYATGIQSIIVKADSEYESLDDFFSDFSENGKPNAVKANVTIGVQNGTTGDTYASAEPLEWGFEEKNVRKFATADEAVEALTKGKITAVIIDNEPAKSMVDKYSGLKILETPYTDEEYAICVNKSRTELLGKINVAIDELKEDGTLDEIFNRYIAK